MKYNLRIYVFLSFLIIVLFASVGVVYGVMFNKLIMHNTLSVKELKIEIREKFNSDDLWLPGEQKQKEVWFENTGDIRVFVRFKIESPQWSTSGIKSDVFSLDYNSSVDSDWTKIGDWYYYKKILYPNEMTPPVLDSVKLSEVLSNTLHQLNDVDVSNQYADINVVLQVMQVNTHAVLENWNVRALVIIDEVTWD